jgi:DNA-directed RNA polymerase I, II, and III subunit RPABC2
MMEHNEHEIKLMSTVVRNGEGKIIDNLHRSIPFVTKYEKARIIGERTRQLNSGAIPFIAVGPDIIDGYLIAVEEFNKKKIPFIVKRPLPSGKCEYWKLSDLEIM